VIHVFANTLFCNFPAKSGTPFCDLLVLEFSRAPASRELMTRSSIENIARAWARAQPVLNAFICACVQNYDDAQDVLQDTAVAVLAADALPPAEGQFNAWALGIARHKVADYYRRQQRHPVAMDAECLTAAALAFGEQVEAWTKEGAALEHCIRQVKGSARRLLELRYRESQSHEEIARITGRTVSSISVSLYRIRAGLRECIERRLGIRKLAPDGGSI
jgi:RNA polymerase sigma-70 factor (ECF subfamily)